jgi:hypothetical protein
MTQPQRFPLLALEEMTLAQRAVHDDIASGPRGGLRGPFGALLAFTLNTAQQPIPEGDGLPLATLS